MGLFFNLAKIEIFLRIYKVYHKKKFSTILDYAATASFEITHY